jgi:hypothetical protein
MRTGPFGKLRRCGVGESGAAFPVAHDIFIALDGALLRLFATEVQRTRNSPSLRLAETHAAHAFDDGGSQLRAKAMFGRFLQNDRRTEANCASSSVPGGAIT